MNQPTAIYDYDTETYQNPFNVLTIPELFATGLIDEELMKEIFQPWESDIEMKIAA